MSTKPIVKDTRGPYSPAKSPSSSLEEGTSSIRHNTFGPLRGKEESMDIGFIGVGNMGAGMANNLLKAGYTLTVNDIRHDAAGPLLERGARWAETPQQVAMQSEMTFTSLPGPPEVEAVALGGGGLLGGINPGWGDIDLGSKPATPGRGLPHTLRGPA